MFMRGIKVNEQFPRSSGQGYFPGFTVCSQSLTERAVSGIAATGNRYCYTHGSMHIKISHRNFAFGTQRTDVPIENSNTVEGSYAIPIHVPSSGK